MSKLWNSSHKNSFGMRICTQHWLPVIENLFLEFFLEFERGQYSRVVYDDIITVGNLGR